MLNFDCNVKPCYQNYPCDLDEKGKIVGIILVDEGETVDKTDGQSMIDSFNLLAANGKAQLILNIDGEKPRAEVNEGPGRGLQETQILSSVHTINWTDYQGAANVPFYNEIRKSGQNYDSYYITPTLIWDNSENEVTVVAPIVIDRDLKSKIRAEGTIKWAANGDPLPTSVEKAVVKDFMKPLQYVFSQGETYEQTTTEGSTISGTFDATLNKSLISGSIPDVVYAIDETSDIAGLGLVFDDLTGDYDITPTDAGVYTFTVLASSDGNCITGKLFVTITVQAA